MQAANRVPKNTKLKKVLEVQNRTRPQRGTMQKSRSTLQNSTGQSPNKANLTEK